MKNRKLTCVDLFAGAGGLSFAACDVGMDVKFAVEQDKHAARTYRENIGYKFNVPLIEHDIRDLDPTELKSIYFETSEPCDLVLGGPPCQGFSTHRLNDSGVADPRNELIHEYFSFVSKLKARAFLMENVPGVLWKRHKNYLDEFYKEARNASYIVAPPVKLDARDFGVPQRRQRVFILGFKKEEVEFHRWPPSPTYGDKRKCVENPNLMPWRIADEIFTKPFPMNDQNSIHMNHSQKIKDVLASTPKNGGSRKDSNRVLPCHIQHNGHKDVYGRIDPALPAPTMTCSCINPSKGRFVHPTENRGISVREAARIQTFPDTFNFYGGLIASGVQIGNAVPPRLGKVLLKNILEILSA